MIIRFVGNPCSPLGGVGYRSRRRLRLGTKVTPGLQLPLILSQSPSSPSKLLMFFVDWTPVRSPATINCPRGRYRVHQSGSWTGSAARTIPSPREGRAFSRVDGEGGYYPGDPQTTQVLFTPRGSQNYKLFSGGKSYPGKYQ